MSTKDSEREACVTLEQVRDVLLTCPGLTFVGGHDAEDLADAINRHLTTRAHADARDATIQFKQACIDKAVERIKELEADASRYQWLRKFDNDVCVVWPYEGDASIPYGEELDRLIDAAMSSTHQTKRSEYGMATD
jgi:hypothetical protein